jgi:hypothetical protein
MATLLRLEDLGYPAPRAAGFSIAFVGAIHLHQVLNLGITGPGMDARLARLRNRLAASGEIAQIAQGQLRAADISELNARGGRSFADERPGGAARRGATN